MSMFQKSVINKHLSTIDNEQFEKAFAKFKENYSSSQISKIKKLKEEEYQDGFLREIFVDVFGYILNPADNHNLVREFKNQSDGKKADGAILKDGNAIAVIELKSTKTKDLTSITEQAFNYKNNQPDCKYVITSNFQKLRFYIDYANEFEEFNLFNLQKEEFKLLYLLLNKDNIFSDLPLKLKKETKFHEENVSDKLYKDYSRFKHKIYNNLVKNNTQFDKLTLFKLSQKFLDRLLFVFFAEDTGLVPPNAISKIIEQWQGLKDLDEYFTLYSRFVKFFGHLDKGHKYKTYELPAYNGGLFAPDEILDNVIIDDEILKDDALHLSAYDFDTEVDVNILGHIFEHSLTEIEDVANEIAADAANSGQEVHLPKKTSKRKKDGVFYTPKYITQYIVENTVGKLCKEKREELGIIEIEFDGTYKTKDGKLSAKGKKLFIKLESYKNWLKQLKIIDPACGSGAFLNQALTFLIQEHKTIDDIIAELTGEGIRLFDTDKAILENNLYGVDINEESVEIAKLSLWLRTAQKGRKLSSLNDNIKCGNSLIDDPEIAGDKAFDWEKEFPTVFKTDKTKLIKQEAKELEKDPDYLALIEQNAKLAQEKAEQSVKLSQEAINYSKKVYEFAQKQQSLVGEPENLYGINKGGFDVVIGNPPYVQIQGMGKMATHLQNQNYETFERTGDLYGLFYELGYNILKQNGLLGFITSNKWMRTNYGKKLRDFFAKKTAPKILIDLGSGIFNSATVDSNILIFKKQKTKNHNLKALDISKEKSFTAFENYINESIVLNKLSKDIWIISNKIETEIKHKIEKLGTSLKDWNIEINRGLTTGFNDAFIINETKKNELIKNDPKSIEIIKPVLRGKDLLKYNVVYNNLYLINPHNGYKKNKHINIENYSEIKNHLDDFMPNLIRRCDKGITPYNLRNCVYLDNFEKEKIIFSKASKEQAFCYDITRAIALNTSYILIGENLKFLLSVLNSKFAKYVFLNFYQSGGIQGEITIQAIEIIPIPKIEINKQQPFIEKANKMLDLNKNLQQKKIKFLNRVTDNFEIDKVSKKLDVFYNYDFKTFVSELKKKKVVLSLIQQDEWEEYFLAYKTEINKLQLEINLTDKEIDKMVYVLYELTDEEIKIVEDSV